MPRTCAEPRDAAAFRWCWCSTASSPFRWADMVNDLLEDREIRDHYEFWFFTYNTGNRSRSQPTCCAIRWRMRSDLSVAYRAIPR
jgi:hypothetical protein